jgi:hypothetical protein
MWSQAAHGKKFALLIVNPALAANPAFWETRFKLSSPFATHGRMIASNRSKCEH